MAQKSELSEKLPLDWESLNQFLNQFDGVRRHFMRAGGELLWALKALVDQLVASLEQEFPGKRQNYEFLYAMQYGIGYLLGRMPADWLEGEVDAGREKAMKVAALESIVGVIDQEISQTEKQQLTPQGSIDKNPALEMKRQSLQSIRKVLVREMTRAEG